MDRFLEKPGVPEGGTRIPADLSHQLPYNLALRDAERMVEDLYDLLHDINARLVEGGHSRLEELLDSAGFSGLISRTACDGFAKPSRELVNNRYPGGYPDSLPRGFYAQESVQQGKQGGLEVKSSRYPTSWQSHSPRAGWFCVVHFAIDTDETKAVRDRAPTTVAAVMVGALEEDDGSWAAAGEGKKRTRDPRPPWFTSEVRPRPRTCEEQAAC